MPLSQIRLPSLRYFPLRFQHTIGAPPPSASRLTSPAPSPMPRLVLPVLSPTIRAVAALSLTQLIGWGTTFYLPAVTGPAMARDLDVPLALVMAGPTLMLIVMAAISWPLGTIFERHGARPAMIAGSIAGAAGLATMGLAAGPLGYALAWTFIGLAGASALTTPAQIAVTEIAGAKARRALGILILAGGLTSTVVWPLTGLLQAQYGWRATTLLFAAAMLVICTPLHWMALARRPRAATAGARAATDEPVAIDRPRFVLFALSFAANGFVTWGFALTIIILFEANGLDHASALAAAAFIGVAQWAGRMLDVIVPKRGAGFRVSLAGAALFPLSLLVLMTTTSFAGAVVFAVLYGIASGVTRRRPRHLALADLPGRRLCPRFGAARRAAQPRLRQCAAGLRGPDDVRRPARRALGRARDLHRRLRRSSGARDHRWPDHDVTAARRRPPARSCLKWPAPHPRCAAMRFIAADRWSCISADAPSSSPRTIASTRRPCSAMMPVSASSSRSAITP